MDPYTLKKLSEYDSFLTEKGMTDPRDRDDAMRIYAARIAESRAGMSHPMKELPATDQLRLRAADAFGVPSNQIDPENTVSGGVQYQEGILSDTTPEALKFYQEKYPDSQVKVLKAGGSEYIGILHPDGSVQFNNTPGLDWGDAARVGGSATIPIAATTLATAGMVSGGLPLMAMAPLAALTGAGAEFTREGVQALYGSQDESFGEYGTRAAISGVAELPTLGLAGGTAAMGNRLLSRSTASPEIRGMAQNLAHARGAGMEVPPIFRSQMTDPSDELAKRFYYQQEKLSREGPGITSKQISAAYKASQMRPEAPRGGDKILQAKMAEMYGQMRPEGMAPPSPLLTGAGGAPSTRLGGQAMVNATNEVVDRKREIMKEAWPKVDEVQAKENPVFDFKDPIAMARERTVFGIGKPETQVTEGQILVPDLGGMAPNKIVETIRQAVNVAPSAGKKLQTVYRLLGQLDEKQVDYNVAKELRSQVGRLLEMPEARLMESDLDTGAAKQMYGALSKALKEPVGGRDAAPGYVAAVEDAISKSSDFYNLFDIPAVGQSLNAGRSGAYQELFTGLASNPAKLEQNFLNVISQAAPAQQSRIRGEYAKFLLADPDPLANIANLKKNAYSSYMQLFPSREERKALDDLARYGKEAASSKFQEAWTRSSTQSEFVRSALAEEAVDPARSRLFRQQLGEGNRDILRRAVWDELFETAIQRHPKSGAMALNPKTLEDNLKRADKAGWTTEIFLKDDLKRAKGALELARLSWVKANTADSLQIASLAGKIMSTSAHTVFGQRAVSRFLSSMYTVRPGFTNNAVDIILRGTGKEPFTGRTPYRIYSAAANLIGDTLQETGKTAMATE